ncbi:RNA polymerase subunit sigma-70 [Cryptosporangium aurantiacum]|uniref:RNA polymerase, sigma subunit, ECF family n=1 Tax=Cryptosporangium aurantiacum TaxID=134849 RepID=A0A1M7R9F2_9ACTN|nr:RNA polymerase subunit sigma-70 [Cryptosporangium aurantiacum]SHN42739.1 RNA polymerase, sigma subunit, ECF family [Cryptosporangium aurantiacum]
MTAFETLTEPHRRELHVHCYRMLASFHEAEDAVQETYLRAWRSRDRLEDRSGVRPWLYRIATNVCLDALRRTSRRLPAADATAEASWLQPYPDRLLDEIAPTDDQPDAVAVSRETIELAFIVALQVLPPRQRAVFLARDVLGWPAAEAAALLGTSVAAANSALQRARTTLAGHIPARRADWPSPDLTADEKRLLAEFVEANERCDAAAAIRIASRDIRITMPPDRLEFRGLDAIAPLIERAVGPDREGDWRLVPIAVNRMPAAASYLRRPGDTVFRAFKIDVLRVADGRIVEITTFGTLLFPALGLPPTLADAAAGRGVVSVS